MGGIGMTKAPRAESSGYRHSVLAMLLLVYTFNFLDRQIVGILAVPIKRDLGLSDTELGLMGGLAFALFYTALAIPIGALADRRSRVWIITISLALWSGFTALCGVAQNFWHLFLARIGVGVGEAGGTAPSYSLIADYYPPASRARAISVYNFGVPIGSAAGMLLGGWIATHIDWRTAFFMVGGAGVVLAPFFRLIVKDPPRGRYDAAKASHGPAPRLGAVLAELAHIPTFWLLSLGAGSSSLVGYGLLFWLPSFFGRSYGFDLVETSQFMALLLIVGGIGGVWAGGWLADRLGQGDRSAYGRIPALTITLTAPAFVIAVLSPTPLMAFPLFMVAQVLAMMWIGPVITAVQHLVTADKRATASAAFLFINNLIGMGAGTVFFGAVSDHLTASFGADSLRAAILLGQIFYLVAGILLWQASRRLVHSWVS